MPLPRTSCSSLAVLRLLLALLLLSSSGLFAGVTRAEVISTRSALIHAQEDAYVLDAEFVFSLTPPLEEALRRGTPLYFVLDTEITRARNYWFDEKIPSTQSVRRLTYAPLTNAYRVDTGGSFGSPASYATLDEALRQIRLIRGRTLIEKSQLIADERYEAAVRLRLDTSRLPKPLQVNTLVSRDWSLDSDWYRVVITP